MKEHHVLKCWPEYFQRVIDGNKTFEVRDNDRGFEEGDTVELVEWCPILKDYTERKSDVYIIGYVLDLKKYLRVDTNKVVFSLVDR